MTKRQEKETTNKTKKGTARKHTVNAVEEAITLPPILDISNAGELRALLLPAVQDSQSNLIVESSGVERLTTPAVQVLLSAARTAESSERTLVFKSPSATMLGAFKSLGLEQELNRRLA